MFDNPTVGPKRRLMAFSQFFTVSLTRPSRPNFEKAENVEDQLFRIQEIYVSNRLSFETKFILDNNSERLNRLLTF